MKMMKVTAGVLSIGSGAKVRLNELQAASRAHKLEKVDGDVYQATSVLQFKAGEILGLDIADVAKPQREHLEEAAPDDVKAGEAKVDAVKAETVKAKRFAADRIKAVGRSVVGGRAAT